MVLFRSGPYGVSFDIPFDQDASGPAPGSSTRGMIRSVSTDDGSGFKVQPLPRGMKRNLSFQPVNGTKVVGIAEEGGPEGLAGGEPGSGPPSGHGTFMLTTPSMEEALQIIHSPTRPAVEGIQNGFFLHSQDQGPAGPEPGSESDSQGPLSTTDTTEVDTGVHVRTEDLLDEDSSLKDCSVNMDLDLDSPSPCASSLSKSPPGLKMTSFAEQKLKKNTPDSGRCSSSSLKTPPEGSDGVPLSVSWAPTPEHSPVRQPAAPPQVDLPPTDPAQAMATEMVQLRMRLEEKRKAIEAQKKKVEAAFSRHRQRAGRSAFLSVVKRRGDGAASGDQGGASPSSTCGRSKADTPDGAEQSSTGCWSKSPGVGGDRGDSGQQPGQLSELDLAQYTVSIEKLNQSLAFLQAQMQRLSQQQDLIMAMRGQQQQAWLIPAPHPTPSPQRPGRAGAVSRSSGPSSPADSPLSSHRSPTNIKRKSASFHSRSPRAARPSELKLAPYNRVLAAPQSVDSLPRLRRFSPCQPLAPALVFMEEHAAPAATDKEKSSGGPPPPEGGPASARGAGPPPTSPVLWDRDSSCPEVLSHPVTETFTVAPPEVPAQQEAPGPARSSLIEVPLSDVEPREGVSLEEGLETQQDQAEGSDGHQMCRGFFFKVS